MIRTSGWLTVSTALLLLSACGGSGGSGNNPAPAPPNAIASANVFQGTAPLTVLFDASHSTDPQGLPLSFTWSFTDGSLGATGASVSHTFANHGSYTATVTVSSGSSSATQAVSIQVTAAPPNVQVLSIPVNVLGISATSTRAQLVASDRENLPLTYSITAQPTLGSASINAATGNITYTIAGFVAQGASDSLTVAVANVNATTTSPVNVTFNADPLLPNQWHIQNWNIQRNSL